VPRIVEPGVKVVCLDGFISRPGHAAAPGELVEVASQRLAEQLVMLGKVRFPTPEELAAPQSKTADQSDRRNRK
jgi:hypothetical protein